MARQPQAAVELIRCESGAEGPLRSSAPNAPELLELRPEAWLTKPGTSHTGLLPIPSICTLFRAPGQAIQFTL